MKPTFANLVDVSAAAAGLTHVAMRRALEAFFAELAAATWSTGRVQVPGLGLFQVRTRRRRSLINPQTNRPLVLASHRSVYARVAKSWRRRG